MDLLKIAFSGIWLMLPALIPNPAAVLFGGGPPIDFGKCIGGRRILGDGKTWLGFIGGVCAGISFGIIMLLIAFQFDPHNLWGFKSVQTGIGVVSSLSVGSLLGDMGGSFIKRRLGIPRGAKAPGLDQYDFLVGSIVVILIFYPDWFISNFVADEHVLTLITLIIIVPILHKIVNIIGYKIGKKNVPW
ncbi:MAG: CDP-2,3-bis-(O-geranylgeranyl)-sn-glycerol synthase [Methanomassiliicoccales archaeon]